MKGEETLSATSLGCQIQYGELPRLRSESARIRQDELRIGNGDDAANWTVRTDIGESLTAMAFYVNRKCDGEVVLSLCERGAGLD